MKSADSKKCYTDYKQEKGIMPKVKAIKDDTNKNIKELQKGVKKWEKILNDKNTPTEQKRIAIGRIRTMSNYANTLKDKQEKPYNYKDKYDDMSFDQLSQEMQRLVYLTPIDTIADVLRRMNFKGKIQKNKLMLVIQLLQNFKNEEMLRKLLRLLN
jgi:hypothetical protein